MGPWWLDQEMNIEEDEMWKFPQLFECVSNYVFSISSGWKETKKNMKKTKQISRTDRADAGSAWGLIAAMTINSSAPPFFSKPSHASPVHWLFNVIIRPHCSCCEGTKVALMAIRPPISSAMREEAALQRWQHGSVPPHWIYMADNGRNPEGQNNTGNLSLQYSVATFKKKKRGSNRRQFYMMCD